MKSLVYFCAIIVILTLYEGINGQRTSGPYYGTHIGTFRNYAHSVGGDVYAVDEDTFFIRGFRYDGSAPDTFFWAGSGTQPNSQGFKVLNEFGREDSLQRYDGKDITINLPPGRKMRDIGWLSVWSTQRQSNFGDVLIPPNFQMPQPRTLSRLSGGSGKGNVRSGEVVIIDAKTILIPQFNYDGSMQETYFLVGTGSPSSQGTKIPDERGMVQNLRAYNNEDVRLNLPNTMTVKDIDWLSIWNFVSNVNLGFVSIPSNINVPPPSNTGINLGGFSSGSQYGTSQGQGGQYGSSGQGSGGGQYGQGSGTQYGSQYPGQSGGSYSGSQYPGQSGQQYPGQSGQQYPGQSGSQYPGQSGSQYPGGQYGGSQYPGQSGQQYPGQSGQQYPGQSGSQYPGGQYGGSQYPGQHGSGSGSQYPGTGYGGQGSYSTQHGTGYDNFTTCEEFFNGKVQVSWKIAGDRIYLRLDGEINDNEYMAFGISGSPTSSQMIGSDVAIIYQDGFQTVLKDFYLDAKMQCDGRTGVCPDITLGGVEDFKDTICRRQYGITECTFNRLLSTSDRYDKPYLNYGETYVVAAYGNVMGGVISKHTEKTAENQRIDFSREGQRNCRRSLSNRISGQGQPAGQGPSYGVSYGGSYGGSGSGQGYGGYNVQGGQPYGQPGVFGAWQIPPIQGENTIRCMIGPSGDDKGYYAITGRRTGGQAWWCNERLIPEIYVIRGQTYTFIIEGGDDQRNQYKYNPFYITTSEEGGYADLTTEERQRETVFAGVTKDYRESPRPNTAGHYCEWRPRDTSSYNANSFEEFRQSLEKYCDDGLPATLTWTPSDSVPDVVYYQSYKNKNLGWKIRASGRAGFYSGAVHNQIASSVTVATLIISTLLYFTLIH